MATYDLEEQEQLAELKAWWKQYGNLVTGLVTAAAIGVLAWQGWNWYERDQAAKASGLYSMLQRVALERDTQKTKTVAGELVAKFGGTAYAQLGALTAAKLLHDTGDLPSAKAQLSWLADNGKEELRDIGRLRLANILLDEKAYDEALKVLAAGHAATFDVRYAETRGDVLAAQGKKAEAAVAYREALAGIDRAAGDKTPGTLQAREVTAPYRQMLQQKLDSLGDAK